MRHKVGFVGAGMVGAESARSVLGEGWADVAMVDVAGDMAAGKALDMTEAAPLLGSAARAVGGDDYALLEGASVVIVTAGIPRQPGMSRDDLLKTNLDITKAVAGGIADHAPGAVVIMVTNPLDAIVYAAHRFLAGANPVIGMAGALDSARFRAFLALEAGVAADDVQAMVLGSHGDAMVPLASAASIVGIPVTSLISPERLAEIVVRTQKGGGEIVALLKTGSAYYAPGLAAARMARAITLDEQRIIPTCTLLQGEFGAEGVFMGVPAVLGAGGVARVLDVPLSAAERALWEKSLAHVRGMMAAVDGIIG